MIVYTFFALIFTLWISPLKGDTSPNKPCADGKNKCISSYYNFQAGEELKYKIRWKFLTVGYSTLSIPAVINFENATCLIFRSEAHGTPLINKFFPVHDVIESYYDVSRKLTLWNSKELHEGNYHRSYEVRFYPSLKKAEWKSNEYSGNTDSVGVKKPGAEWKYKKGHTFLKNSQFIDVLSAIYYNRSYNAQAEPGQSFNMEIFDDLKMTTLKMKIIKKEKMYLTLNGVKKEYNTILTSPLIETSGIFKSKGGLLIWISDDTLRIPVKMSAGVPYVGSVSVELFETKGLKDLP